MDVNQAKKFMEAVEASGIKTYEFDIDNGTHLYHNDNAIAIPNMELEAVVAFRRNNYAGSFPVYAHNIQAVIAPFGDIHQVTTAGNYEQIKKFADVMGVTLDENDLKIVLNLDKANSDIKPQTGNYVDGFHYISQKQYLALSDEEKAKYDSEKKEYEDARKNYIGKNVAASITL